MIVLVTGADGSIGQNVHGIRTDIDTLDVTDWRHVQSTVNYHKPDVIIHLAAVKDAPQGEATPEECVRVNAQGTANVVAAAREVGAKVITASTCKAAEPETCYGASKLLGERMTLNAGGVVVRFYNVIESAGNVFRLWENIPAPEPIPVTPCERYFITRDQAVKLLQRAVSLPSGRYAANPGSRYSMEQMAHKFYPRRPIEYIPARRGDRLQEPLCGRHETAEAFEDLLVITSPHD
jgi:FlaA1/EpsC-like NDP-sugar epimerase